MQQWAQRFWVQRQVKSRLQRDPYSRLQSLQEVNVAAELGIRIDVNRATIDDWLRLPGLSIHQARTLVQLSGSGVQFYAIEDVAAALGLPVRTLAPLSPVLQFCHYDPDSAVAPPTLAVNQASLEQLQRLPGMSPAIAAAIVQARRQRPFTSLADLQHRLRVSSATLARWMHCLRI